MRRPVVQTFTSLVRAAGSDTPVYSSWVQCSSEVFPGCRHLSHFAAFTSAPASSSQTTSTSSGRSSAVSAVLGCLAAAGLVAAVNAAWPEQRQSQCAAVLHETDTSNPATQQRSTKRSLLPLETKQRVFFKYEKRMRESSTLEKVFSYFSSVVQEGQQFMAPADLLRAVVPTYPASSSVQERAGSLAGERQTGVASQDKNGHDVALPFTEFDVDGDGLINFHEFLLLLTLLSIPTRDVRAIFDIVDTNNDGSVDFTEFQVVMGELQTLANVYASSSARTARQARNASPQTSGLLLSFFGPDQSKRLQLDQFTAFLHSLHTTLVLLEFDHYDVNSQGWIPGLDFARSLAAPAELRAVEGLLAKAEAMPDALRAAHISREEFKAASSLAGCSHGFKVGFTFMQQVHRPVTKSEFSMLAKKLCGQSLSPDVVGIIFEVFGDSKGQLDIATFLNVLDRRSYRPGRGVRGPTEPEQAASHPATLM